ncbi:MAG TPA: glycosyltransferase family 39 protein [Acidimicrobiales bacterium]|nr:glycosyltransferase family 39 protein [Acidimicrobiales bacterium]
MAVPIVLAAATAVWAVVGSRQVFPYLSDDHDEGLYLLQADALADGHLFPPAPRHPDAFTPWLSVLSEDKYVLKYAPVHASVLAVGVRLGSARWALGLIAAGVVALSYALAREVLGDRKLAAVATAFLALSPLFLLQSTTFLPYCSSLLLLEAFTLFLLRGVRTGRRRTIVLSGFLFGVAVFARPYDALVFAFPLGLYFLFAQRHDRAALLRNSGRFLLGAALPLVAMLAYFEAATGSPFRSPFNLLEPQDTLGFGTRKLLPTHPELAFTPERGWYGVVRYVFLTSFWGFGGLLLVGFFVVGVVRRRMTGPQAWLGLVGVSFSLGYLFFWGAYATSFRGGLTSLLGPFYFLPVLIPMSLFATKGFSVLWGSDRPMARLAFAAMAVASGYLLVKAVDVNLRLTEDDRRLYASVTEPPRHPAVVFVPPLYGPHLLHPFAWLRNEPDYDGTTVWALDRGDSANLALLDDMPGRAGYKFRIHGHYRANPPDPRLRSSLERLRVVEAPSVPATLRFRNPTAEPYVVVSVAVDGRKDSYVLDSRSAPGRLYRADLTFRPGSAELTGPVEGRAVEPVARDRLIVVTVEAGPDLVALRPVHRREIGYDVQGPTLRLLLPGNVPVDELRAGQALRVGAGPGAGRG